MIKNCIVPLTNDVNRILNSFVNFSIDMISVVDDTDKKTNKKNIGNIEIIICYGNDQPSLGINLASGFERFIIGLAICIALTQITMFAKPNFFIVDEGWSCMDSNNRDNVEIFMKYIKNLYDHVIIISHLDELLVRKSLLCY